MSTLLTYIKAALILFWLFIASIVCILEAIFFWGKNRDINHDFVRLFGWGIWKVAGLRGEVLGRENIVPGQSYVLVGNHQSEYDLGIIGLSSPPRTVVIGKKEILFVPLFGLLFVMAGNVLIARTKKRQALEVIQQATQAIRERHVSVYIFPEGTRNKTDELLLPFKKGAFHMAIKAGVPVLPVVCARLKEYVDIKHGVLRPGIVPIRILPPVDTQGMTEDDIPALTEKVRGIMLEAIRGLGTRRP